MMPEGSRVVPAVHGRAGTQKDPDELRSFAEFLRRTHSREQLLDVYGRYSHGLGAYDATMRQVLWLSLTRSAGHCLRVSPGVKFKHVETFDLGDSVFIGEDAFIQGRYDGRCVIGNHVWIGPQSYFDARDLILEDYVGWGPGARVLGSAHTGLPVDIPIIQTDLTIAPVRICEWADVGTGATILPGITVGRAAIIGAGAVVTKNVPPLAVAAGVPAKIIGWRNKEAVDEH